MTHLPAACIEGTLYLYDGFCPEREATAEEVVAFLHVDNHRYLHGFDDLEGRSESFLRSLACSEAVIAGRYYRVVRAA